MQEAPCHTYPPDALSPHKRCLATGSLHKKCPVAPKQARGFSLPVACTRATPPSESHRHVHTLAQGVSYGSLPLLLLPSPTVAPCLSCGSGPFPWFLLLWCSLPQPVVYHSPAHGTLLLSPSGCLNRASPSLLPRTGLQSLSLSAQPPLEHLRLWCPGWWFR